MLNNGECVLVHQTVAPCHGIGERVSCGLHPRRYEGPILRAHCVIFTHMLTNLIPVLSPPAHFIEVFVSFRGGSACLPRTCSMPHEAGNPRYSSVFARILGVVQFVHFCYWNGILKFMLIYVSNV
jgi:hypothetical protein